MAEGGGGVSSIWGILGYLGGTGVLGTTWGDGNPWSVNSFFHGPENDNPPWQERKHVEQILGIPRIAIDAIWADSDGRHQLEQLAKDVFYGRADTTSGIVQSQSGHSVNDIMNQVIARRQGGTVLQSVLSGVFGVNNSGINPNGGIGGVGGTDPSGGNNVSDGGFDWTTAAALAGDLIGAGASYYGSNLSARQARFDIGSQLASGYDPAADPLLALLNAQGMAGLGFAPDPNILAAASPINRLENNLLNSLGGDIRWNEVSGLQTAIRALQNGATGPEIAELLVVGVNGASKQQQIQRAFLTALTSGGYSSVEDLQAANTAYMTQANSQASILGETAAGRSLSRAAANQSIDQILSNYPAYDASNIEHESMLALQPYQAQELEQANAGGYNPATNVALTRTAGIRDALAILSGRQNLANTSLTGLGSELSRQTNDSLATSGQNQAARTNAASLASQQAMALNGLRQQSNLYQAGALGGGIAAAGNQLGGALSNAANSYASAAAWQQLLDKLGQQNQPGAPTSTTAGLFG